MLKQNGKIDSLALGGLAVGLLFALAMFLSAYHRHAKYGDYIESNATEEQSSPQKVALGIGSVTPKATEKHEDNRESDAQAERSKWADPNTYFTFLLVVVGGLQVWVLLRQVKTMGQQTILLENSRMDSISINRPYVFLKEIKRSSMVEDGKIVAWLLQPILENSGNTQTINYLPFDRLEFVPRENHLTWKPYDVPIETLKPGTPIGPRGIDGLQELVVTVDELRSFLNGGPIPVITLWAFYNDAYEGTPRHHLRVCFIMRPVNLHLDDPKSEFLFSGFGHFDLAD